MAIFSNLLLVLQIGSALAMVGLILLQHGKGAEMGAAFGSGASGSLFGASGSANFLSRATAVSATVFLASTLAISAMAGSGRSAPGGSGSVLELPTAGIPASAASASASAAAVPGSAASVAAPVSAASGVGAIPGQ